jgi:geranylgeranyl diphosphate synthase type II
MRSIRFLHDTFDRALKAQTFDFAPVELYRPITYTLSLGGKRLRPVLMLMGCDLFGGDIEKALNPAIGLELFHNFTLLHDDIMDDAPLRRGQPTVYKKWDTNTAILSGDTMFAIAYSFVAETDRQFLPEVLKVFTRTATQVCEGQQYDLIFEKQDVVSIDDYLRMIHLKTGVLFGASLNIGAIIAGAPAADADNLYAFGENIGIAFQLKDDLLDIYGNEATFGKITGGDILVNKKTYLYLKALELAGDEDRRQLREYFKTTPADQQSKVTEVKRIYDSLQVKDYTLEAMDVYHRKALDFIDKIHISDGRKREMIRFAGKIMQRNS